MKNFIITLSIIIIVLSAGLCFAKPKMHKPFSLNVIEYAIKFKTDGTAEMTKTTTTTTLEHKE